MTRSRGSWISLFSGGKDSSYALYRALERGRSVGRLLTVHPEGDSYMYHVPATDLAELAAESIGIEAVAVHPGELDADRASDASAQGDRELEPLESALAALDDDLDGGIEGLIVGAVESDFQHRRISALCDRYGWECFAPLWNRPPRELAEEMLDAGFDIRVIQVAAGGLDRSWLGRRLDRAALADLEALSDSHGVHILGEGGEFETFVVDGPHMDRAISLEYTVEWEGTRGSIAVTDATLEATPES
ncbi:diphthine--ammonia ligase [Halovivax limisalsi]|uniref:diphthine--ammonia ligase n=1 Tax=Halovivax limisalsi TaxID=1453760 RepID=UPI001FFD8566|nr:diphthine--ammonia ligase [Halovivax limisalsi]